MRGSNPQFDSAGDHRGPSAEYGLMSLQGVFDCRHKKPDISETSGATVVNMARG